MFVSWCVHTLIAMLALKYGSPHFPRVIPGNFLDQSRLVGEIRAVLFMYQKCIVIRFRKNLVKVHHSLRRNGVNVLGTDLKNGLARMPDMVAVD